MNHIINGEIKGARDMFESLTGILPLKKEEDEKESKLKAEKFEACADLQVKKLILDSVCGSAKCIYIAAMQILTTYNQDGMLKHDVLFSSEQRRRDIATFRSQLKNFSHYIG